MTRKYSLLLDTHVVIWMATAPDRLPAQLLAAIKLAETRFVSHATAWEIQIKRHKHGPRFPFSLADLTDGMKTFSCSELQIGYGDILGMDEMKFLHTDPFDRMLMSQAARRSVYLATLDQDIIRTFEAENAFNIFTDRPRERA